MGTLGDAIDHLYAIFESHRVGRVAGCPCCVSLEEEARLHSRQLRELAVDDVDRFAFSALNTWGTLTDLKHFLPRILELHAAGQLRTESQVIYGKFVQEGPWPADEREALERYTSALLVHVSTIPGHRGLDDLIESAGLAGMDVPRLLDDAFSSATHPLGPERASALASLVEAQAAAMSAGAAQWIWWKTGDTRAVERWLLSGGAYRALVAAFEAQPGHRDAGDWAAACDILEALGGARGAER